MIEATDSWEWNQRKGATLRWREEKLNDRERDQQGGRGLLESVYEEALAYELELRGMAVDRQYVVPVSKYDLTRAGRTVALAGLKLRSLVLIPELARMHPS